MIQHRKNYSNCQLLSIQNQKYFCAYHPNEFLTNFCKQKQCLMPLCPSCISQHTQQHFKKQKKPAYESLNQALKNVKQSCYFNIITLQKYRLQNQNIYQYISNLEGDIHCQLQQKKIQIFKLITKLFDEFQLKLFHQIVQDYKEKNIYNLSEAINADSYIQQEINALYQKISLLKSQNCLSSLITFHAYQNEDLDSTLHQFGQYLLKHRNAGKIKIQLNSQMLNQITINICEKLLKVQSLIQEKEEQIGIQPQFNALKFNIQSKQLKNQKENNNSINQSNKLQKNASKGTKIQLVQTKKSFKQKNSEKKLNYAQLQNINQSQFDRSNFNVKNKQRKRLIREYKQ